MSIASALVNRPPVILADEPTALLDSERAMAVIHIRDGKTQEEAGEGRALNGIVSFAVLNRFPQKVR